MTDNEITIEKTFSEELPYFKERIKEIFDNYDNPDGYADMLYLSALRDSHCIVRKAEEEITRQQAEIEQWKEEANRWQNIATMDSIDKEQIKSEAIKEFAEKVKETSLYEFIEEYFENAELCYEVRHDQFYEHIDNLVKEMESENNG